MFVELNDLDSYLNRVALLNRYTTIVEVLSVDGNEQIVETWKSMLMQCKEIVDEGKKWMQGVDRDIMGEVFRDKKTEKLLESRCVAAM